MKNSETVLLILLFTVVLIIITASLMVVSFLCFKNERDIVSLKEKLETKKEINIISNKSYIPAGWTKEETIHTVKWLSVDGNYYEVTFSNEEIEKFNKHFSKE